MKKGKKICCRITPRRILGAIVVTASIVNLVIVGTVLDASASTIVNTVTATRTIDFVTMTFFAPTATLGLPVTPSPTEQPTHTPTWTATFTSTFTPTETSTPTSTATPWPTATTCAPWYGWPVYIVQTGDTLSDIADLTGSSVTELMTANCLPDTHIYAGQRLYVPRLPVIATDTFTATPNIPTYFGQASACSNGRTITFTVTATDVDGIELMTYSYRIENGETNGNFPMRADGDTYYGDQPRTGESAANYTIYYWFVSTDTTGSTAQSGEYSGPLFCGG